MTGSRNWTGPRTRWRGGRGWKWCDVGEKIGRMLNGGCVWGRVKEVDDRVSLCAPGWGLS